MSQGRLFSAAVAVYRVNLICVAPGPPLPRSAGLDFTLLLTHVHADVHMVELEFGVCETERECVRLCACVMRVLQLGLKHL
eukprot:3827873-Prymnesium_polylepis.1